jgi:hypothetical protein
VDRKAGITISAVVTGGGTYGFGADNGTMQNIARWGGGRYYQVAATLCCRLERPRGACIPGRTRRGRKRSAPQQAAW